MPRSPFRGSIPGDRLYDPRQDLWVRWDRDSGAVVVGITAFGLFLSGELVAFTAKPRGARVERGRGLGTVESSKTVLAVHAPLSLEVLDINEGAEERPALVNREPYGAGWLLSGQPLDWDAEREFLVDAAAYIAHIRAQEPEAVIEP